MGFGDTKWSKRGAKFRFYRGNIEGVGNVFLPRELLKGAFSKIGKQTK